MANAFAGGEIMQLRSMQSRAVCAFLFIFLLLNTGFSFQDPSRRERDRTERDRTERDKVDRDRVERDRDQRDRFEDEYEDNNIIYLAYRSASAERIFITSWDGARWSAGEPVRDALSDVAPAIIRHGDTIFLAYKGRTSNRILLRIYRDGAWSPEFAVGDARTNDSPSLAFYKGYLHMAYKGVSTS